MRRPHRAIFLVLIAVLGVSICVSCDEPPLLGFRKDPDRPDVRWTEDWKFITVYLDGAHLRPITPKYTYGETGVVGGSRAMTPDTARMGFSYFEVFFYCDGEIKRTDWEIGKRASVYELYRDVSGGVDYGNTSVPNTGITGSAGKAAILFAGRKNDKTLLAVGKIYSVDDVPGTVIKGDSSYVTFQVFSLIGGASYEAKYSSFLTGYDTARPVGTDNTLIMEADIGGRKFPLYKLPQGKTAVNAEYTFKLDGAKWEDFANGVMVADVYGEEGHKPECGTVTLRNPRYPAGSGRYWYPVYKMDTSTKAWMVNNQTKGMPVDNRIQIVFDTVNSTEQILGKDQIGLFTLGFRIPVVPLMPAKETGFISPSDDDTYTYDVSGITWFIRPAYQSYYYNIDNGVDAAGGGVLMGFFPTAAKKKYFDRRRDDRAGNS